MTPFLLGGQANNPLTPSLFTQQIPQLFRTTDDALHLSDPFGHDKRPPYPEHTSPRLTAPAWRVCLSHGFLRAVFRYKRTDLD